MRLLPDRHLKTTYKRHYDANYEKIMAFRNDLNKRATERQTCEKTSIKATMLGALSFLLVLGCVLYVAIHLASYNISKQNEIKNLQQQITELDEIIQEYQVIDSEEKYQQIDDALQQVVRLQTMYVTNTCDKSFDVYAERYLGSFNTNWAESLSLIAPVWTGYVDKSCTYKDFVDMLFVLYDNNYPVMTVHAKYAIDQYGNIERMIKADRQVLK